MAGDQEVVDPFTQLGMPRLQRYPVASLFERSENCLEGPRHVLVLLRIGVEGQMHRLHSQLLEHRQRGAPRGHPGGRDRQGAREGGGHVGLEFPFCQPGYFGAETSVERYVNLRSRTRPAVLLGAQVGVLRTLTGIVGPHLQGHNAPLDVPDRHQHPSASGERPPCGLPAESRDLRTNLGPETLDDRARRVVPVSLWQGTVTPALYPVLRQAPAEQVLPMPIVEREFVQ